MGKNKKDDPLAKLVDDLIADAGEDRGRISEFLNDLLAAHPDQPAGIAEYVAKLADALTRTNQLKVNAIKALTKSPILANQEDEDEMDEITKEIGLPFGSEEMDEGSN